MHGCASLNSWSACYAKLKCTAMHFCREHLLLNVRRCKISTASHASLQLFSNYARLAVHKPWAPISSLLVFPGFFNPFSFLNHNYLLIIEALSSHLFDFGSKYLKRVGLAQNNTIMSGGEWK